MINEILQWIAIIWVGWSINNLGIAIKKYAEVLKTMCKWEDERRKREK